MKTKELAITTLLLMSPAVASAETIYGADCATLFRFDSEAPNQVLGTVALSGINEIECLAGLDFDNLSGSLYGLGKVDWQIGTPPPNSIGVSIYRMEPATGEASLVWAGIDDSLGLNSVVSLAVDGERREIRMLSATGQNLRLALDPPHLVIDTPLAPDPNGALVAHARGANGLGPITTYAILGVFASPTPDLVRIGGPDGDPPAGSGEVTWITSLGPGDVWLEAFDISPTGRMFGVGRVSTPLAPGGSEAPGGRGSLPAQHLFEIDPQSGLTTDRGQLGFPGAFAAPIAVVPELGVVAIPALGRTGEAIFAVVLLWVAGSVLRRRLRQTPDSSGPSAS